MLLYILNILLIKTKQLCVHLLHPTAFTEKLYV